MRHFKHHPLEVAHIFNLNGFVNIPEFFKPDEIKEISEAVDRYIHDIAPNRPSSEVFYENPTTIKQLQVMHQNDPFFKDLIEGQCAQLAEMVLGEPATHVNLQYFNKPPGGAPTPPHQDGYYFKLKPNHAVTMWLALEDVDHENGYVSYVQGSHHFGMRAHGKSGVLGFSQHMLDYGLPSDLKYTVSLPAAAGDMLAHHSLTIHKANGNTSKSRSRRALGFIYYASRCEVDEIAVKAYKDQMEFEAKQRETS